MNDSDRREAALQGFDGKRLMLRDPIGKNNAERLTRQIGDN